MICDYCNNEAELVSGETVYPHRPDLYHLNIYHCAPCDAWVGCHRGTTKPLGRLANRELREAKMEAHTAFDQLWKRTAPAGSFDRNGAYKWLAQQLGIPRDACHIEIFNVEQCRRVVEVCSERSSNL